MSELIRRTGRTRLVLLLSAGVILLAIWTAVKVGAQRVEQLSKDFMVQQVESLKELGPVDTTRFSEIPPGLFIQLEQRLLVAAEPFLTTDKEMTPVLRSFIQQRLDDWKVFDRKRDESFSVSIKIPYVVDPVVINVVAVADILPIVVLLMVLINLGLRFQQRAYEALLAHSLTHGGDRTNQARRFALTEFYAGSLRSGRSVSGEPIWEYKRPLILLPETLILGGIFSGVLVLAALALGESDFASRFPVRSILFGYNTAAWIVMAATAWLLVATNRFYSKNLFQALGRPVRSSRLLGLQRPWFAVLNAIARQIQRIVKIRRPLTWAAIAIALASLLLPWLIMPDVKFERSELSGYHFVWHQPVISPVTSPDGISLYMLEPSLYWEMRLHVWIAFSLVALSMVDGLKSAMPKPLAAAVRNGRRWVAWGCLFLIGNLLFYFGVLLYQANGSDLVAYMLDTAFGTSSLLSPRGMPILLMNPGVGFLIFLSSSILLAWVSIDRRLR